MAMLTSSSGEYHGEVIQPQGSLSAFFATSQKSEA